jgi:hypothetical protein
MFFDWQYRPGNGTWQTVRGADALARSLDRLMDDWEVRRPTIRAELVKADRKVINNLLEGRYEAPQIGASLPLNSVEVTRVPPPVK